VGKQAADNVLSSPLTAKGNVGMIVPSAGDHVWPSPDALHFIDGAGLGVKNKFQGGL
jgi:hypothetical protein